MDFLPQNTKNQFRSGKDPVSTSGNPENYDREDRREMLQLLKSTEWGTVDTYGDPWGSAPESPNTRGPFELQDFRTWSYGYAKRRPDWVMSCMERAANPGNLLPANCILARKLIEQDVKICPALSSGMGSSAEIYPME